MMGNKITATAGKVFRRISDGILFGNEIYLGMAFTSDGVPYEELPEHFEEVDDETPLITEELPLVETIEPQMELVENEVQEEAMALHNVEPTPPKIVTVADYYLMKEKVEYLIKLIGEQDNG